MVVPRSSFLQEGAVHQLVPSARTTELKGESIVKKRESLSTTTRPTIRGQLGRLNKAYARLEEIYRKCDQEIIWWTGEYHENTKIRTINTFYSRHSAYIRELRSCEGITREICGYLNDHEKEYDDKMILYDDNYRKIREWMYACRLLHKLATLRFNYILILQGSRTAKPWGDLLCF